ncbi:hypothetical protein RB195_003977 [Necator americanus]|uniref:SXP/RAL-2 family protein Ani s 5-like cation-binding domain-containing protein n=1 Tax=Necator americanus TaxID=51031 RepID=A0ABR1DR34_NECAM
MQIILILFCVLTGILAYTKNPDTSSNYWRRTTTTTPATAWMQTTTRSAGLCNACSLLNGFHYNHNTVNKGNSTPCFLSNISTRAVNEYKQIKEDMRLPLNNMEKRIEAWASKYGVKWKYDCYKKTVGNRTNEFFVSVKKMVSKLDQFFTKFRNTYENKRNSFYSMYETTWDLFQNLDENQQAVVNFIINTYQGRQFQSPRCDRKCGRGWKPDQNGNGGGYVPENDRDYHNEEFQGSSSNECPCKRNGRCPCNNGDYPRGNDRPEDRYPNNKGGSGEGGSSRCPYRRNYPSGNDKLEERYPNGNGGFQGSSNGYPCKRSGRCACKNRDYPDRNDEPQDRYPNNKGGSQSGNSKCPCNGGCPCNRRDYSSESDKLQDRYPSGNTGFQDSSSGCSCKRDGRCACENMDYPDRSDGSQVREQPDFNGGYKGTSSRCPCNGGCPCNRRDYSSENDKLQDRYPSGNAGFQDSSSGCSCKRNGRCACKNRDYPDRNDGSEVREQPDFNGGYKGTSSRCPCNGGCPCNRRNYPSGNDKLEERYPNGNGGFQGSSNGCSCKRNGRCACKNRDYPDRNDGSEVREQPDFNGGYKGTSSGCPCNDGCPCNKKDYSSEDVRLEDREYPQDNRGFRGSNNGCPCTGGCPCNKRNYPSKNDTPQRLNERHPSSDNRDTWDNGYTENRRSYRYNGGYGGSYRDRHSTEEDRSFDFGREHHYH